MSILNKCKFLYGDDTGAETAKRIGDLIDSFRDKVQSENYQLSEKDIVLITYGDQLRQGSDAPLKTLGTFLDEHCDNLINSVHILPFYPYTSDDGFSVVDYLAVDSNLGSWEDVQQLAKTYRLMFDAVINHTSKSCEWFKGYLEDKPEYQNFYHDIDPKTDLSKVIRPRALPLLTPFESPSGTKHVWTTFSDDQVDINFSNPEVLIKIVEVLLQYLVYGSKLVRMDAIAFMWKTIGTTCLHLEETHNVIKLFRDVYTEIAPETIIITETNVPHEENISYFGNGTDEAQMVYNFSLPPLLAHAILRSDSTTLSNWAKTLKLPHPSNAFFNFLASHDGIGVRPATGILPDSEITYLCETAEAHGGHVSYKDNGDGTKSPYELNCNYMDMLSAPEDSDELRRKRFLLAQAVMIAMPGVPGIYFHSLVGSRNDKKGVEATGRYRSINREKFDYDAFLGDLKDEKSIRFDVFKHFKDLLAIRTNEPCFHPEAGFEILDLGKQLFALKRSSNDRELVALYNLGNSEINVELEGDLKNCTKDLVSGETLSQVALGAYEFTWLGQA